MSKKTGILMEKSGIISMAILATGTALAIMAHDAGTKDIPTDFPMETTDFTINEFKPEFPDIRALADEAIRQAVQEAREEDKAEAFVALSVDMDRQQQEEIARICESSGVSFPLVMAIIGTESEYDPHARSVTGDTGYMQINDCNQEALGKLGFTDLYDPYQNVAAGCHILRDLIDKYGDDTAFILMAYNAGEKGALRQKEKGIHETDYSKEIMGKAESFSSYIESAH